VFPSEPTCAISTARPPLPGQALHILTLLKIVLIQRLVKKIRSFTLRLESFAERQCMGCIQAAASTMLFF
jgi:hypothetical protein